MDLDRYRRRTHEFLADQREPLFDFACRLIATPSENPPGDERAVAQVAAAELRALGLGEPQVHAKAPARPNLVCPVELGGAGPCLVYNGHLDTKPVGDRTRWRTDPFEPVVQDGRLYGLGSTDMKGAVAALTYAAAALRAVASDLPGALSLVFSADEETGGAFGAQYLCEAGLVEGDAALIAEPSGITRHWEHLYPSSRGETCFRIRVRGTQMHGAIHDLLPSVNASVRLAEVLVRTAHELEFRHQPHPLCPQGVTASWGSVLEGGVFYGVYPGTAEFGTDIRTLPGMTREQIAEDIEAFLDRLRRDDPELEVEYEFEPLPLGWIETVEVPPEHPLVRAALRASEAVLGQAPTLSMFPAWTDARFFSSVAGIPTIPAFGPGELPLAHAPNEYIEVESLPQAAAIYALTAAGYLAAAAH